MRQQEQLLDYQFPDTTDIERLVLADAVSAPEILGDIIPAIHPDFFSQTSRRNIWEVIVKYYNEGRTIDLATVGAATGKPFIDEVLPSIGQTGSGVTAIEHVAILRSGAAKRRAYYAAATFLKQALEPASMEQDILSLTEAFVAHVEGPCPVQVEQRLDSVLNNIGSELEKVAVDKAQGKNRKITTGFRTLDWWFYQGWTPGQLVILAARPSVGKTAVMLQMAKAAAASGFPVQIFSLEMTAQELGQRMLLSTEKLKTSDFSSGDVDWQAFEEANGQLSPLPLYINDFSRSLDEIVTRLNQAVKQQRCKIAFIDYLGLFQDALTIGNVKLYQVIAKITGTLKAAAKRLGIPVVLLCQMNRDAVREKRAPELYDLRDSGSIEQDADIVLMLDPKPDEGRILMWVRKNRNGKRDNALILVPNNSYTAFEEGNALHELRSPSESPVQTSLDLHYEPEEE